MFSRIIEVHEALSGDDCPNITGVYYHRAVQCLYPLACFLSDAYSNTFWSNSNIYRFSFSAEATGSILFFLRGLWVSHTPIGSSSHSMSLFKKLFIKPDPWTELTNSDTLGSLAKRILISMRLSNLSFFTNIYILQTKQCKKKTFF